MTTKAKQNDTMSLENQLIRNLISRKHIDEITYVDMYRIACQLLRDDENNVNYDKLKVLHINFLIGLLYDKLKLTLISDAYDKFLSKITLN